VHTDITVLMVLCSIALHDVTTFPTEIRVTFSVGLRCIQCNRLISQMISRSRWY